MPGDAVHGWRRDVFEAVRALKPGVIRYGGCAVDNTSDPRHLAWDWHDTLGDPDRRKPFWAWGGIQHTGPGLEELVRLIRAVGAEPMMTVRVSKRTASDAADMVEYFNGSAVTPMGKRRAENGHAEPYDIRYWQVGNELGGDAYEAVLPVFCSAMRAVDPGIILLSSFPTDKTVAAGGGQLDYLCPHHYRIGDYAATSADLDVNARRCSASARPVKIAVTEWNVTATDPGLARAKLWSLSGALTCARYRNMLNRRCDMVEIANRSNLINSICAGAIQTDRSRLFVTPTYHVDRLFATLAGNRVLTLAAPATTALDINATYRSGDEPMITIITVNPSLEDVASRVDLSGFTLLSGVIRIWTLADRDRAGEPEVVNSFRDPERIAPVEAMVKLTDGVISYTFPALSLVMMRCPVAAIAVSDG